MHILISNHTKKLIALAAAFWVLAAATPLLAAPTQEYQIKAAFIYNFAQFVEWPNEDTTKPFVIAVVGHGPLDPEIGALEKETVRHRPITVRYLKSLEPEGDYDLVVFNPSEADKMQDLLSTIAHRPVLTVGDVSDFCEDGGIIGFVVKANKVRFVVNQRSAENKKLRINSQLLNLADRVLV